ncbi:MAG: YhcH/YjgK/YiaL family protein [Deltaproteobacteria bacterium]|nr:YhcH/YjgK/YiaL family protein [Deltaproteobacteria bacterium]
MILGSIRNLETDRQFLTKVLVKGLEYLKKTDFSKVATGRYEIEGAAIFALVQEYRTAPKGEKKPEAHRKYVDIQYMDHGAEIIGYGLENPANEVSDDRLAEKDVLNFKTVQNEMDLVLTQGMYAILFPQDIHRPGCHYGEGGNVKKVVLKISKDLL